MRWRKTRRLRMMRMARDEGRYTKKQKRMTIGARRSPQRRPQHMRMTIGVAVDALTIGVAVVALTIGVAVDALSTCG